jgi:hypothetical protein
MPAEAMVLIGNRVIVKPGPGDSGDSADLLL